MKMPTGSRDRRRAFVLPAVWLVAGLGMTGGPVRAEITAEEVALDSELRLVESNQYGAYQHYSIALRIDRGEAELFLNKNGTEATVPVPLSECQGLWQKLLRYDLEALTDARPQILYPDQSYFTVRIRVMGMEREFTAYGVDSLPDTRYRGVVKEILHFGDSHLDKLSEEREGRKRRPE